MEIENVMFGDVVTNCFSPEPERVDSLWLSLKQMPDVEVKKMTKQKLAMIGVRRKGEPSFDIKVARSMFGVDAHISKIQEQTKDVFDLLSRGGGVDPNRAMIVFYPERCPLTNEFVRIEWNGNEITEDMRVCKVSVFADYLMKTNGYLERDKVHSLVYSCFMK